MRNYLKNWNEFLDKAVSLLMDDPIKTRVVLKYKNVKNTAIIKVTNDKKVWLFKCDKEEDFDKIENIITISTRLLANIPEEYENLAKIEEEEKEMEKPDMKKKDKKKKNKKRA